MRYSAVSSEVARLVSRRMPPALRDFVRSPVPPLPASTARAPEELDFEPEDHGQATDGTSTVIGSGAGERDS
jgi:hypothetical protein